MSAPATALLFRIVAIAEAVTWLALLIAMFFKWVLGHEEAVAVPGMVHGIVFVVYLVVTVYTALRLRWNVTSSKQMLTITAVALVASIPPFGTLVFEWWAQRNGHLTNAGRTSKAAAS